MGEELKQNYKKEYMGNIEMMRFIGILLIMGHHLYILGYKGEYLFGSCWVWVDFYFMLTGFFTAKHFAINANKIYDAGREALNYACIKFKRFLPFIIVAVIIQYSLDALPLLLINNTKAFLKSYINMPFEMMLLSSTGIVTEKLAPIWYLSAMLIVMPIMIYLMIRHREGWHIVSIVFPILYFGYMGVNTVRDWPNDFIRAFACMALGSFAYEIGQFIDEKRCSGIFLFAESLAVIGSIYVTIWNKPYLNYVELFFFIIVVIMGGRKSFSKNIGGVIVQYMGKMSLPMFLFHWCVGTMARHLIENIRIRTIIYYSGTILIAFLCVFLHERIIKNKNEY